MPALTPCCAVVCCLWCTVVCCVRRVLNAQVQIYDLSGFKLSFVTGDMFALFKVCMTACVRLHL